MRKKLIKKLREHADEKDFVLNSDKKVLDLLIKGLIKNKEEHGDFYCPCRMITGNKSVDSKNICPCSTHEDEVEQKGHCHCSLFLKR